MFLFRTPFVRFSPLTSYFPLALLLYQRNLVFLRNVLFLKGLQYHVSYAVEAKCVNPLAFPSIFLTYILYSYRFLSVDLTYTQHYFCILLLRPQPVRTNPLNLCSPVALITVRPKHGILKKSYLLNWTVTSRILGGGELVESFGVSYFFFA